MPSPERDPYLCASGSFFFPGLGQVYCGRILRGIIFLVPAVIVAVLWYYPGAIWHYTAVGYSFSFTSHVVDFMVRAIATYGAYNIAKVGVKDVTDKGVANE